MFLRYAQFLILGVSLNTYASHPLCPEKPIANDAGVASANVSAEDYRQAMQASVKSANDNFDWIDDPNSTSLCRGYYQAPTNPNPDSTLAPNKAKAKISAQNLEKTADGFTTIEGDVELFQGSRSFRCDSMRYSEEKQYTELSGNIVLRDKGLLLTADKATLDAANKNSVFHNSQYLLADFQLRGRADNIKADNAAGNNLQLQQASFTVCPPNAETWLFEAADLNFDLDKGWGTVRHAVLRVHDVPVFYFPYFDFPIDDRRKSGFLFPSIGGGSDGIDINVPYYFNIAPNFDMTYQGRYFDSHGYQHSLENRYKNRLSEWSFGGTYINDDKKIGNVETKSDPGLDSARWLGFVQEHGDLSENWFAYIDYQAVSDVDYFRDWGVKGLDVQKSLNIQRSAGLNFQSSNWTILSKVVDYQSLEIDASTGEVSDPEYSLLPQINVAYLNTKAAFSLSPIFSAQYSYFAHDTFAEAQRLYSTAGVTFPMAKAAFSSIPSIKIKSINYVYNSDNDATNANQKGDVLQGNDGVNVTTFSWDNRLFFQRAMTLGERSYTQTLTPRLFYYYAPDQDQSDFIEFDTSYNNFSYNQLYREERFSGYDRVSDANQITLGLDSSIYSNSNGERGLQLGIGQIFYFEDRKVSLLETDRQHLVISPSDSHDERQQKRAINRAIDKQFYRSSSDIAAKADWSYNLRHGIYSDIVYDPYANQLANFGIAYHYENQRQQTFNLGYRYGQIVNQTTDNNYRSIATDQVNLSAYSPISQRWALFGRVNYDIEKSEVIENLAGFKYGSCCWSILFAWQNERQNFSDGTRLSESANAEYDQSWYVQFELTGLGGVSKTISRLLEESIEGFNRRDHFN